MVSDEMLFKLLIRTCAYMRRTPLKNGENAVMPAKKGFGSVLDVLVRHDGITQRKIAEITNMRQPSVSEALESLEKNGYIERKTSEADKRISYVFITEEGKVIQKFLKEQRTQLAESFFSVLSAEEKENLYEILTKLGKGYY